MMGKPELIGIVIGLIIVAILLASGVLPDNLVLPTGKNQ